MDYTMLSIAGYPSSMALGRNLFIFGNHALFVTARSLFGIRLRLLRAGCWRATSVVRYTRQRLPRCSSRSHRYLSFMAAR
jgi:hypothetical protein